MLASDTDSAQAIADATLTACRDLVSATDPKSRPVYVLAVLFLKYASDAWVGQQQPAKTDNRPVFPHEEVVVPLQARFTYLFASRNELGNPDRLDAALDALEAANPTLLTGLARSARFGELTVTDQTLDDIVRQMLEAIASPALDLNTNKRDVVATAFDLLIEHFAAADPTSHRNLFVPPMLARVVTEAAAPHAHDRIYDPACGSGGLLLQSIQTAAKDTLTYPGLLDGQNTSARNCAVAAMRMLVHKQMHSRIRCADPISRPAFLEIDGNLQQYDVLLSNLLFLPNSWHNENAERDPFRRFFVGIPPKTKPQFALILHMLASMNEEAGRMVVLVPSGVLFRGASERDIRKWLVEENLIESVVGLPEKLFYGTPIAPTLLVLRKKKRDNRILLIDASREYEPGRHRNRIGKEHVDRLASTLSERQPVPGYAHVATSQEIKANDFNLNITLYVQPHHAEPQSDVGTILEECERLQEEFVDLDHKAKQQMERLGYRLR